jgi:hypothetical protein
MVMRPAAHDIKNDCAGESQQKFTRPIDVEEDINLRRKMNSIRKCCVDR